MTFSPDLTIIMVSYNTREMTLAAIRSCLETTLETPFRLVVLDNASSDGSAEAIAEAFGRESRVELIRSDENLGFARANNLVAAQAKTEFLLLLNPDTECLRVGSGDEGGVGGRDGGRGSVDALMGFARETPPEIGIWGGRTVFSDGTLNPSSCAMRITLWSMICRTTGLYGLFAGSQLFNSEAIGDWPRDTVREVDIIVGCLLLIRRDLWERLGGFDLKYFMYGEDADLCLRTGAQGYRAMVTPAAEIVHHYSASTTLRSDKIAAVAKARVTLIRDHLPAWQVPPALALMWIGAGLRHLASALGVRLFGARWTVRAKTYGAVWRDRADWLAGYGASASASAPPGPSKARRRGLNRLSGLRNALVSLRRWLLVRVWGMDIHPTVQLSLSSRFDRTFPVGVHVGAQSYIAFEARILCHDRTRGLYLHTRVGRNCFIGGRSLILPGVEIGDGCIVGAGSVVTKSVPPGSIVAGNPARIIRSDIKVGAYGRLPDADATEAQLVDQGLA